MTICHNQVKTKSNNKCKKNISTCKLYVSVCLHLYVQKLPANKNKIDKINNNRYK